MVLFLVLLRRFKNEFITLFCGKQQLDFVALCSFHSNGFPVRSFCKVQAEIPELCAFADGESVISGAEELRVKESDRIATTAEMLAAVGASVTAKEDGFVIRGKKKIAGGDVDPRLDHRIAMSAAVALCASERGGEIKDAACADISFPNFYSLLG